MLTTRLWSGIDDLEQSLGDERKSDIPVLTRVWVHFPGSPKMVEGGVEGDEKKH